MPYESEDTTALVQAGPARFWYPFIDRGDVVTKIVEQEYYVQAHKYVVPAIGTAYSANGLFTSPAPTIGNAYFIGDSEPVNESAGLIRFARRWANVPASRNEYSSYAATFPGIANERGSFTLTVTAQITYDYFRVGAGLTYTTPQEIPIISATAFLEDAWGSPSTADGFFINNNIVNPSTPSLTAWLAAAGTYYYKPEASKLERWQGNIWVRTSLAVLPI